jgi:hypothetical protein
MKDEKDELEDINEEYYPDCRDCQSAMEDLSHHAQGLLCGATEGVLNLPAAELAKLTRFLRAADRGVRKWQRRLRRPGESERHGHP